MLLVVGLTCCGGKDSAATGETTTVEKPTTQQQTATTADSPTQAAGAAVTSEDAPGGEEEEEEVIKNITFSPSMLRTNSDIIVNVDLGDDAEREGYSLQYVFWKNAKKVHKSDEGKLEKGMVKRGDFLQVEVTALDGNNDEVDNHRSHVFEVLNSPPVIKNLVIPDIKGFGLYTFTVEVEDADQDTLTFKLEGKDLPSGLQVDATSGTVTYQFSDPPPEKLNFVLLADDGNGGKAKKSVSMTFKKRDSRQRQNQ